MSGHYELIARLRQEGYRLTPQREMILLALHEAEGEALTAEALHRRVQALNPYVDRSTLYRTLDLLSELGLVCRFDPGDGVHRYELREEGRGVHLLCRRCGKLECVEESLLAPLAEQLLHRYGFALDGTHLLLHGLCAECRAAEEADDPDHP